MGLYETGEWINDQNETHQFTSDRYKPPTVLQSVF